MTYGRKRVLLIDGHDAERNALRRQLEERGRVLVCGEAERAGEAVPAVASLAPDVVVIAGVAEGDAGLLCQQLRHLYPQITCIAACPPEHPGWEVLLRNLGVWVVPKPVLPEHVEMVAAMQQYSGHLPVAPHLGGASVDAAMTEPLTAATRPTPSKHLITVYGPKGGVGKTFLSRELAIHFARNKREGRALKVLAVDFNLDLGTFATTLNLPRTPHLYTWVRDIDAQLAAMTERDGKNPAFVSEEEWQSYCETLKLDPGDVERYVVEHPETGLHVLTSPREIRDSFEIRNHHLFLILEALKRSRYDVIIIDTAPDTSDATIQALFFADRVVMVGNPVVDAIENIQRMLKLLREAEYPEERIHICINRLQRREMFTLEEMRAYFQLHPARSLFSIPDDEEVKRSVNTGVPLMLTPGRSAARESIEAIAAALIPPIQTEEPAAGGKPSKSGLSLWKWLTRKGEKV